MTAWHRRLIGWGLALVTTLVVLVNQCNVGIARDEVVYMQAGDHYADWWAQLGTRALLVQKGVKDLVSKDGITRTFGGPQPTDNNREHPPLMKTLFGLSHRILSGGLGVDDVTAYRLPAAVLHGLLVALVVFFVLEIWGLAEALVAALLVMTLPRALFHAGLACFDAPIMTLWFATVYAYWRCLNRKWPWQVGVVFGLALATKHTALLLPFALGLHYLIAGFREQRWRGLILYRWRVIVSLAVIAPLVFLLVWPWLWIAPVQHVREWLAFHMNHVHYNFEYLGTNWNAPRFPWHVALVTTLYTVPVATLGGAVVGTGVWIARRKTLDARMPGTLIALSLAASMGPFFLGTTPIFGAEKHWMPALPSICIAAGVGTVWAARTLFRLVPPGGQVNLWIQRAVFVVACGLVVGAGAVETATAQPYALTWYNALAGGAPGGADRGMNRQFWGVSARGVLPVLEALPPPPPGQKLAVYWHDASPAWGFYAKQLPRYVDNAGQEQAGIDRSQIALVIHELHFNRHDYMIWKTYGTVQPMFVLRSDGVPIVSVYRRPSRVPAERP
ncbi:MAG TPA: glycosyltransferase family 39 protein [Kofleriaceae bacterium]|nr:glycosyltransferase family 39 protein [Kofleriaceae bacterium]